MNVLACLIRERFICVFSVVIPICLCYSSIVFCEENSIISLENKILSHVGKRSNKLLDSIDEIDTIPTDQAITLCVILSDYYLGEAGGALFREKITRIGERILPYLVQKSNMHINCNKKYKNLCYENTRERNVGIEKAIEAIKKGVILYAIFPEKLDIEAKGYLEIIEIFLEDYRKKKGNLPKELHELREYAWREYGYKLKVFNPWGQPYQYSLRDNNKYVLEIGDDNPYGWPRDEKETSHISPTEKKEK